MAPAKELGDLCQRILDYARGRPVLFDDLLDLDGATPFQQAAWLAARRIPWGETRSYAWLAQAIGRPTAARAVGQAMARNRLPIIVPCHRVIASGGGLGGYSGGTSMKEMLLRLEGALPV